MSLRNNYEELFSYTNITLFWHVYNNYIPVLLSFSVELSSTPVTVDNSDNTVGLLSVSSSQVTISLSSAGLNAVIFFEADVACCRPVFGVEHNTGDELACGKTGDAGFSMFSPDLFTKTCTGRE